MYTFYENGIRVFKCPTIRWSSTLCEILYKCTIGATGHILVRRPGCTTVNLHTVRVYMKKRATPDENAESKCKFQTSKLIRKRYTVCTKTLQRWDKSGKVKTLRTPTGKRLYDAERIAELMGDDKSFRLQAASTFKAKRVSKLQRHYL